MINSVVRYVFFCSQLLLLGFGGLKPGIAISQNLPEGIPPIRNFSKKVYSAASQNWAIAQGKSQNMYFANNMGLLRFDGTYWQTFPNANRTITRSLYHRIDNVLYAGGQGEIGYYSYNSSGLLEYHSLNQLIPEETNGFEDVWSIIGVGKDIVFRTSKELFVYSGESIRVLPIEYRIDATASINGQLYAYLDGKGLCVLEGDRMIPINESMVKNIGSPVTSIIEWSPDTLLLASNRNGLFWCSGGVVTPLIDQWKNHLQQYKINQITLLKDGYLGVATAQNGILVFQPLTGQGQVINKGSGLQSNSILSIYQDHAKDIWVTSENGIDLIQYHSAFRYIYPDGYLRGPGYAAKLFGNSLYLGTSNGLYQYLLQDINAGFELVKGSEGQVWQLDTLAGKLMLGHHSGAYEVDQNKLLPLYTRTGAWKFLKFEGTKFLIGTYEGLLSGDLSNKDYGIRRLEGFKESSRILVKDKFKNIWLSHPYRGVYQLFINKDEGTLTAQKSGYKEGLPGDLNNYVYNINNIAYVSTEYGLYKYDQDSGQFIKDDILESAIASDKRIQLLFQDADGDIWFYTKDGLGLLVLKEKGIVRELHHREIDPLPEKLLGGFEFIGQLDEFTFIMGCEEGFLMIDKRATGQNREFLTKIHSVSLLADSDSIFYSGLDRMSASLSAIHQLKSNQNKLRFIFTSSSFGDEKREFRYRLEGLDQSFSEWTTQSEVTFSNLKPGKYTFFVQSRIGGKVQHSSAEFAFEISAPWYKSTFFKLLLALATGLIVLFLFMNQRKGFEMVKTQLTNQHQEEVKVKQILVEQSEQAIIQLKNEKLKSEIQHKNNELASATMHLVQKQELLASIQAELSRVIKQPDLAVKQRHDLQNIIQKLKEDVMMDDDWQRFTSYFDEVHSSFLNKLKKLYPHLTANDHKLCAYIRMNLSTKDIAYLMNISVRGVEGSRYRLRRKLGLNPDVNLNDFMQQIG